MAFPSEGGNIGAGDLVSNCNFVSSKQLFTPAKKLREERRDFWKSQFIKIKLKKP